MSIKELIKKSILPVTGASLKKDVKNNHHVPAVSDGEATLLEENSAYSSFAQMKPIKQLNPIEVIKPGVRIDHQANKNTIAAAYYDDAAGGLCLDVKDRGQASWFTLNFDFNPAPLLNARFFGVIINQWSSGFINYRIVLRYHTPEGFRDTTFRDVIVSSGGDDEQISFIKIDKTLIEQSKNIELLLFFDGRTFKNTFKSIEGVIIK